MKLLSLNYMDLASTHKKLSIKRMLLVHKLDIVLLQETLGSEVEVKNILSITSPFYTFMAQSPRRHFGGLAIGWNQSSIRCTKYWGVPSRLGIQI